MRTLMMRCCVGRRLGLLLLLVGAVLVPAALGGSGCTTSEDVVYVGYSADEAPRPAQRREAQPDDPLPPIGNVQVISGDTVRMTGGRMLKLYGVRAPQPGEPYYLTSKRYLQTLVGHQIVRFTYKEGTRYTDPVWYVNLLVPNHQQRQGASSANALMLANGFARIDPETPVDRLTFARVGSNGKLENLSDERNKAIREQFRRLSAEAQQSRRNIFSGQREP